MAALTYSISCVPTGMNRQLATHLAEQIGRASGQAFEIKTVHACAGGCINQAYRLIGDSKAYFVKLNDLSQLELFNTEALALREIESTQTIRVPRPICRGAHEQQSYLVLEALNFSSASADSWARMGEHLAALHRHTQSEFGWQRDNFIGSSPQSNTPSRCWADFFTQERIGVQLKLAEQRGMPVAEGKALLAKVHSVLEQHHCQPSLLHGDLWSGNAAFTDGGLPVIFDPATYYGDREADLAFTEFFAGFSEQFYRSYEASWPLAEGYAQRKPVYNLYQLLNHANLFGGSYWQQARVMIRQILD